MNDLKMDYKFLKFRVCTVSDKLDYTCFSKRGEVLGFVAYHGKWKEYEYLPEPNTGYTHQCHDDISDFLKQLNAIRREDVTKSSFGYEEAWHGLTGD